MRIPTFCLTLALLGAASFADEKEITVNAGGKPALKLAVPKEAEVAEAGGETTIKSKTLRIYLWHVPTAKTVADVVSHVGDAIKSEFVHYAVSATHKIQVAGHEATHLEGKGEEADDNDPGTADVVIFTDGKHVFAACVHGERDEAAKERTAFLEVLKSAKAE